MRVLQGELPTGTDDEACAYLNTASLTQPMDHDSEQSRGAIGYAARYIDVTFS